MTDLVERLRKNQCPENHGCGTQPRCVCADMDDAADEITRLQSALTVSRAEKEVMREALEKAARQFREYERMHRSKDPSDRAGKAVRNGLYAHQLEVVLQSTPPTAVARVIEAATRWKKARDAGDLAGSETVDLMDALAGLDGGRKG